MLNLFIILFGVLVLAISYLPHRQTSDYVKLEQHRLLIEMNESSNLYMNRDAPEKRYRISSPKLTYDEKTDTTTFNVFSLVGSTGQHGITGHSLTATLANQQVDLIDQVSFEQHSTNKETRFFTSDHLILHLKSHQITSPGAIEMRDEQQQINASSLIGNYEEGWYEFTQHVKTHWR